MRTNLICFTVLATSLLIGCGPDGNQAPDAGEPPDATDSCAEPASIVYLNRSGGTYGPGSEDSRVNTTSTLGASFDLPPWPHDDASWTEVVACVREALSPFHVEVVEADPGAVDHTELVFTTVWPEPTPVTFTAQGPATCSPLPRAIGFVMGDAVGATPASGCQSAMWALGTTASVEVTTNCDDFMSMCFPVDGTKAWDDQLGSCGYYEPEPCRCGGGGSNSYQTMIEAYGPACP